MSSSVSIKNVTKMFGEVKAVNNASIEIKKGEFFTLLGSSGCGKTTLLRTIAGFYNQEEGSIFFGEQKIDDVPAHKRNIAKNEIEKRVSAALDMVQLGHLKDRQPSDMSGGQQQRVALARAIVIEPGILLMDEPLSNLDAKLRLKMRNDIKKLQSSLGITTIYVTHDQQEALAVSDRIAVMDRGVIQQIGTPQEIYMHPVNKFVANFIGTTNFITGEITKRDGKPYITISEKEIPLDLTSGYTGKVSYSIRPEGAFLVDEKADDVVEGRIINATFLGDFTSYEVELTSKQIMDSVWKTIHFSLERSIILLHL